MEFLEKHRYSVPIIGILLVIGMLAILFRAYVPVKGGNATFSGGTLSYVGSGGPGQIPSAGNTLRANEAQSYIQTGNSTETNIPVADLGSLSDLVSFISSEARNTSFNAADTIAHFYEHISVNTPASTPKETKAQADLREYGNEVGAIIKGFEDYELSNGTALSDYFADRSDQNKKRVFLEFANQMAATADSLSGIEAPRTVASLHQDMVTEYKTMSTTMRAITDAGDTDAVIEAINGYNAAVNAHLKTFSSLAILFEINGVHFSSTEQGSIFDFGNK